MSYIQKVQDILSYIEKDQTQLKLTCSNLAKLETLEKALKYVQG